MISKLWLIVLSLLLGAGIAHAQKLYKWVDKEGRVSYHDQPPVNDAGYRVEEKAINTGGKSSVGPAAEAAAKFPVILYSAPKCSSCDVARAHLQKRAVPFSEKNVEGNRKLQEELTKQSGGLAVPTIAVGPKIMRGYLESLLDGELDEAGYPKAEDPDKTAKP